MASRTQLLEAVRDLRANDVAALLRERPDHLAWRDERGRNLRASAIRACGGWRSGSRREAPVDGESLAGRS